jgi:hypothetical protein
LRACARGRRAAVSFDSNALSVAQSSMGAPAGQRAAVVASASALGALNAQLRDLSMLADRVSAAVASQNAGVALLDSKLVRQREAPPGRAGARSVVPARGVAP